MINTLAASSAANKGFGPKGSEEAHTVHARASEMIVNSVWAGFIPTALCCRVEALGNNFPVFQRRLRPKLLKGAAQAGSQNRA